MSLTFSNLVYSSQSIYIYKSDICLFKNLTCLSAHKSVMTIIVKAINSKEYALIQIILIATWTCISLLWNKKNDTSFLNQYFPFYVIHLKSINNTLLYTLCVSSSTFKCRDILKKYWSEAKEKKSSKKWPAKKLTFIHCIVDIHLN